MSRPQHDVAAKSCPAHNFVIWSRISQLFHRNDHHIEMTCRAHHFGPYLESQRHSMTFAAKSCLTHNFVIWSPILKLFDRNDHYFEIMCHYLAHCLALCTIRIILFIYLKHFEGPVGDYCIARNTIKCLFYIGKEPPWVMPLSCCLHRKYQITLLCLNADLLYIYKYIYHKLLKTKPRLRVHSFSIFKLFNIRCRFLYLWSVYI